MRYRNNDLKQPCPLNQRLWDARNGFLVGVFVGAVIPVSLIGLLWLAAGFEQSLGIGTHYCARGLSLLLRCWALLLIVAVRTVWICWERELRLVNQGSNTIEEVIELRLAEVNESLSLLFDPQRLAELQALKRGIREGYGVTRTHTS